MMKKTSFRLSVAVTIPVILAACANPGIVQISPDTYLLSKQDRGGIFGNAAALKVEVIREANAFAEGMGKVAIPISANEVPLAPGRFANFEYQFRVVDSKDPEAKRTALVPRADIVIEKHERSSVDVRTKDESLKSKDVYSELLKLDDLRKRGIISEAEFDAEKKKLLQAKP